MANGEPSVPCSWGAERAVFCAAILNPASADQMLALLQPADFFISSHRLIFGAVARLRKRESRIDLVLLADELEGYGELERVGGPAYLASLLDERPFVSNVGDYASLLRRKRRLRDLARVGEEIAATARQGNGNLEGLRAKVVALLDGCPADEPSGLRRIRTWDDIPTAADLPDGAVDWVVSGMIPRAGIVLLSGLPGLYKTWLGLVLARSIGTGKPFLGRECQRGNVVYLDLENPLRLMRERCELLGLMNVEGFRLWGGWEQDPPPRIGDFRLREIASSHRPVIVFDSLIRFAGYQEENAAADVAPAFAELRRLAHLGATPLVIHHPTKTETSPYRGSGDILAGVDVAFAIRKRGDTGELCLQCFKSRFGEQVDIALQPNLDGRADFDVYESPTAHREQQDIARLQQVIASAPGLTQSEIVKRSGLPQRQVAMLLARGVGRWWRMERGDHNARRFFPL